MGKTLSPKEREIAYSLGHEHYSQGEYRKAKKLFLTLIFSDPSQSSYWKGFAASVQMQEKYAEAAQAWAMVALLNERDPLPHFHAAECLLAVGEKSEAKLALKSAEERLKGKDRDLKHQIKKLKVWLSKKEV